MAKDLTYPIKRPLGRPLKFETPEDLEAVIQEYFAETADDELTVTGLCLAIGTNRSVLDLYKEREGYSEIVTDAKMRIENAYERSLRKHGRSGDIFALKNFGWKDKSEQALTGPDGKALETSWTVEIVNAKSSDTS